jgi:hypothetical protein
VVLAPQGERVWLGLWMLLLPEVTRWAELAASATRQHVCRT